MARAVRRTIDIGQLAAAAQRPGVDPRIWIAQATVLEEPRFSQLAGLLVDVQYEITGDIESALIEGPYAGQGFGAYFPVDVGDPVLVAIPMGDNGWGPQLIARCWDGGTLPPPEAQDGSEENTPAVKDAILRMKDGRTYFVFASGAGKLVFKTDSSSTIEMQDASQAYVRGNDQLDALNALLDALNTFVTTISTAIPAPPNAALTVAEVLAAATPLQQAIAQAKTSLHNALSTVIKGQ